MFDGRDYHHQFEEACKKLSSWAPEDVVRGELEHVEWILWEAIRGVFFLASAVPAFGIAALLGQLFLQQTPGIWHGLAVLLVTIVFAVAGYWLLRFVFWAEVSRHVHGRKFGK